MTPASSFPGLAGGDSINFMAKTSAIKHLWLHEHAEQIQKKYLSEFSIPHA